MPFGCATSMHPFESVVTVICHIGLVHCSYLTRRIYIFKVAATWVYLLPAIRIQLYHCPCFLHGQQPISSCMRCTGLCSTLMHLEGLDIVATVLYLLQAGQLSHQYCDVYSICPQPRPYSVCVTLQRGCTDGSSTYHLTSLSLMLLLALGSAFADVNSIAELLIRSYTWDV